MDYAPTLELLECRDAPAADLFGFSGYGTPPPGAEISICDVPNDPYVQSGSLWGLTGAYGVGAPQAWDVTVGTTAVTVGVVDTGIDYNHPDLYKNVWLNQGEIPAAVKAVLTDTDGDGLFTFWDLNEPVNQGPGKVVDGNGDGRITAADVLRQWSNGVSDDGDAYRDDLVGWDFANNDNDPIDDHSHGTHVGGTIGGVGNNALGVAGVNWKTQLMAVKMLDAGGSGTWQWGAQATVYAVDHGARLTSNSWGGSGGDGSIAGAVSYAEARGVLFVAAAGNNGQNNDSALFYPASYPNANVISVAATDINGTRASFSNYGLTTVDLGAPGVGIISTVPGGYASYSGTSMATPHVAGTAALVAGQHPDWSAGQVKTRILATVTPLPSLTGKTVTGGLLNAAAAAEGVSGPEISVADESGLVRVGGAVTLQAWPGVAASKTFTVTNVGTEDLFLGNVSVPQGFALTSAPKAVVGSGEFTTFTVTLNAPEGAYSGTVSFATNDVNENPFSFTLVGAVKNSRVLDDRPGSPLYRFDGVEGYYDGNWSRASGQGYQDDVAFAKAEIGWAKAAWVFAVQPGAYRVSTTWSVHPNRATDAPYYVMDGAPRTEAWNLAVPSFGAVRLNQELTPDDRFADGTWWEDVGIYAVSGNYLTVVLDDDANEYVIADAVRVERVVQAAPPPVRIVDDIDPGFGVDNVAYYQWYGTPNHGPLGYRRDNHYMPKSTKFGVPPPVPPNEVFWKLAATPGHSHRVSVTWVPGPDRAPNAHYQVWDGPALLADVFRDQRVSPDDRTDAGAAWEDLGVYIPASATLTVKLLADGDGLVIGDAVRLEDLDAPAPPPPPPQTVWVLDDGSAGFSTAGPWTLGYQGQGYQNDVSFAARGTGSAVASWAFAVTPGTYRVSATWSVHPNRATDAPYTVYDGAAALGTVRVNQEAAPNDRPGLGVWWEDLGVFTVAGNSLVVRLTNDANEYVIADAVRVEKL